MCHGAFLICTAAAVVTFTLPAAGADVLDVDAALAQLAATHNIKGGVFVMVGPDASATIHVVGNSDCAEKEPVTKDTAFMIASPSKTYTGQCMCEHPVH